MLKGNVVRGSRGRACRTQAQTAQETSVLPMPCLCLSFMSLEQSGLERDGEPNRCCPSHMRTILSILGWVLWDSQPRADLETTSRFGVFPRTRLALSPSTQRLTTQPRKSTELTSLSYPSLRVYRVTPYLSSCEGTAVARDGTPGMDPGWDTAAEKGKCPSQNGSTLGRGERA